MNFQYLLSIGKRCHPRAYHLLLALQKSVLLMLWNIATQAGKQPAGNGPVFLSPGDDDDVFNDRVCTNTQSNRIGSYEVWSVWSISSLLSRPAIIMKKRNKPKAISLTNTHGRGVMCGESIYISGHSPRRNIGTLWTAACAPDFQT